MSSIARVLLNALRVSRAVTRLTVYRPLRVRAADADAEAGVDAAADAHAGAEAYAEAE